MIGGDGIFRARTGGDRRNGSLAPLRRLARYRLVVPILRGRHHTPDYTARAVFVGLLVAFTPTVGIQMPIVAAIWALVRALRPEWSFNLVIALAWTWVTNVVTVPPLYYLFLITGQVMLGRWSDMLGYDAFASRLAESLAHNHHWVHAVWSYVTSLFDSFGVPMFVGSLPWMVVVSWIGYRWSFTAVQHFHALRERRQRAARERLGG